jgi:uncharacterized membrane-anchored protein
MRFRALGALAGALMLLGAGSATAALTDQQVDRLIELIEGATDASAGIEVGHATVTADGARAITGEAACEFNLILNADVTCEVSAILIPPDGSGLDSINYFAPQDIGHVDMEEWTDGVSEEIDEIWQHYVEGTKAQSERLGEEVIPLRWVLYPTLDKERGILIYGILVSFAGNETINLMAIKFTRKGFSLMRLITNDELMAAASADFANIADYASNTYLPATGLRYADFKVGDHVAEIGAVGVLASVMGVKYASNKGTLAAIGAAILIFAKKAWFLVFAIPVALWAGLKGLFRRGG